MDIQILYEDRDILLLRKPHGVPSQPDLSGQPDVWTELKKTHATASLIHRLDTPTGGTMVFGLSPKATARLCALVQDHEQFCKEYLVLLSAPPSESEGVLRDRLYHDKQRNKAFVVTGDRKGSKEAVLDYKTLASAPDGHTLLQIRLHTGRTHQIRVQLASRGLPLVGDGKYGSREKAPVLGLWAHRLSFPHPITGKEISVATWPHRELYPWSLFPEILRS